ncbi:hypothetical protein [Streptomyces sp. NPDC006134]
MDGIDSSVTPAPQVARRAGWCFMSGHLCNIALRRWSERPG